jgi:predicted  nucleic acid-binding Zn-ribbon protein
MSELTAKQITDIELLLGEIARLKTEQEVAMNGVAVEVVNLRMTLAQKNAEIESLKSELASANEKILELEERIGCEFGG